jgi:DNA invertase Pin-like site-specific DNA recombinase
MGRKPRSAKVRNAKLVLGLVRVSTDLERQGNGADAQVTAIEAWAKREGATVAEWFVDEVTGGAPLAERPALLHALRALETGEACALVFQKWDRFGRAGLLDTAIAESAVRATGASLISADGMGNGDDPGATLQREVVQAVNRYEKAQIRSRITLALAEKKKRGELTGKAPYGMRRAADGVHLETDEAEQATIAKARALRASGMTIRGVIEELEADADGRYKNRAGKAFGVAEMHAMLRDVDVAQRVA